LLLPVGQVKGDRIRLTFRAEAYLPLPASTQHVTIVVNDTPVGRVRYDPATRIQETSILVPFDVATRNGAIMNVDFIVENMMSPRQAFFLKRSATIDPSAYDTRRLGIHMHWLKLDSRPNAE